MKKLLALLTALMLCAGCCASYAQTGRGKEDYLGYWKLEAITLMGMNMSAESVGWNGFMSFREDDTAIFCLDDDAFSSTGVAYENGIARLTDANVEMPCVIGADGKLRCETTIEDMTAEFVYVRTEYPALPEPIKDWPGEYELISATVGGRSVPAGALTSYGICIYEDGFGTLTLDSESAGFRMWEENGAVRGVDTEDLEFELWSGENGELCLRMIEEDLVIVARRKAAAQPPAAETPVPAAAGDPFLGEWQSVSVMLLGVELSLSALGLDEMSLRVEPGMAYLTQGDTESSGATSYVDDQMTFTDGTQRVGCTVEDGWLYMGMIVDGVALRVKMERVGEASATTESPVVPAPADPASAFPFDGVWHSQSYRFMGVEMSAETVDLSVELVISGIAATISVSGDTARCFVRYEGNTCTLYDDSGSTIVCVLGEDGRLSLDMESDGLMMTILMVRDGDAPVQETPVAEEPVVEEPITEEPETEIPAAEEGFDGTWTLVEAVRDGEIVPASELGLTGSLVVTGSSARYTLGDESTLGLVSADGTTLKFVGRGSHTFTLNAQGMLQLETTVDGETLTLRFSRGGMPVEEPEVEEPIAEEPETEIPAAEEGFDGTWTLVQAVRDGEIVPASELGLTGSLVVTGSSARYTLGDESTLGLVSADDTTLKFVGRSGHTFTLNAQGMLQLETTVDGETLTLRFSRDGMPVEEPEADEPVVEEPVVEEPITEEPETEIPAAEEGFDGTWTLVQAVRDGEIVPASELGLTGSLVVTGSSARYTLGDESTLGLVSADGTTLKFVGRSSHTFTLNAQGMLQLETTVDGETLTLRFSRDGMPVEEPEADEPVVEEPVVDEPITEEPETEIPAAEEGFDGTWTLVQAVRDGEIVPASELGLTGSLVVTGSSARYTLGDESTLGLVSADGTTLKFVGRSGYTFTLNAQGMLQLETTVDGETLTLRFSRDGMPVEEPEVEELIAEETETETPAAEGFDGTWTLVQAVRGGEIVPASELGLTGSLVVTGSSARYTLGDESTLGLVSIDGTTLKFVGRSSHTFTLNAQGMLQLETTVDGETLTLRFSRDGMPVEEPEAEEPVVEEPITEETETETPAAEGFDGTWTLVQAVRDGEIVPASELGLTGSLVVTGSSARYTLGDESTLGLVSIDGTTLKFVGRSSHTFTLNVQGMLQLETTVDGETLTLRFSRDGMPVEEPEAEEPVVEEPVVEEPITEEPVVEEPVVEEPVIEEPAVEEPVEEEPTGEELERPSSMLAELSGSISLGGTNTDSDAFNGSWTLVLVERQGERVPAAQLGLSGSLVVSGNGATYILDAQTIAGMATRSGTTLTLMARGGSVKFTLGEDGFLCRNTLLDGDVVVLCFARGDASAAQTPAAQPVAEVISGFEGRWSGDNAMVLGMPFTLEELEMSAIELEIAADGCFLTDNEGRRAVNTFRDGERLILTDGALRWVFRFDGQDQPLLEMTREEVLVQIPMTPMDGAPMMQPARVDTPEVTEKVCDFCKALHNAAQSHSIGSMTVCPACFSRYFE